MRNHKDKTQYLMFVGKKIAMARHMRSDQQETVAKATGISQPLLSKIENGSGNSLNILLIIKLMVYLDIPWNDLCPPKYSV